MFSSVVNDAPEKVILCAGVLEVSVVPLSAAPRVVEGVIANVSVTPLGMPVAVSRIGVLFNPPLLLLFEFCAADRHADGNPSVMTNEAKLSTTFLFVKTVAVP